MSRSSAPKGPSFASEPFLLFPRLIPHPASIDDLCCLSSAHRFSIQLVDDKRDLAAQSYPIFRGSNFGDPGLNPLSGATCWRVTRISRAEPRRPRVVCRGDLQTTCNLTDGRPPEPKQQLITGYLPRCTEFRLVTPMHWARHLRNTRRNPCIDGRDSRMSLAIFSAGSIASTCSPCSRRNQSTRTYL